MSDPTIVVFRSLRCFLYSSSVCSCHLFLISSASVRVHTISVLYCSHLCMKCSLGIFYFLEDISSLSPEKAMAPYSSTLAWKIPWMGEPGGLQSMGSLGVRHDWATSLSLFTFMHWRRKWQPTPMFLPGESHRWSSLVGCCLWGHTESDTTEAT